jgi:hypothetical protein
MILYFKRGADPKGHSSGMGAWVLVNKKPDYEPIQTPMLCYREFKHLTGIKLRPGQEVRIQMNVVPKRG